MTDENLEDFEKVKFKRRLKTPEKFEVINRYPENYDAAAAADDDDDGNTDKYTCLCSENTCRYLMVVKHITTTTCIALGSICYLPFNEENGSEIYYHTRAKKCNDCKKPLVSKECKFTKNTNKKCDGNALIALRKEEKHYNMLSNRQRKKKKK